MTKEKIIVGLKNNLQKSLSKEEIKDICNEFCEIVGFDNYFLYGSAFTCLLSPPDLFIYGPGQTRPKKNTIDAIVKGCLNTSTPIISGNFDIHASGSSNKFYQHTSSNKLTISYPVHFPQSKFAIFYMSSSSPRKELSQKVESTLAIGNMFAHSAGMAIVNLLEADLEDTPPYLSKREKECLLLASDGNSSHEISNKVGLSAHTINFYLKKARNKLHSKNIQGAISKAMLMGEIKPQIGSESN